MSIALGDALTPLRVGLFNDTAPLGEIGNGNLTVANGNMLVYDAENRIATETDGVTQNVATYMYDGNGHRVEKLTAAGTTVYVYDAFERLGAEYSTVANTNATYYSSYDHLGTIRLITDSGGNVISWHDYLPFGEEILARASRPGPAVGTAVRYSDSEIHRQRTGFGERARLLRRQILRQRAGKVYESG